MKATEKRKYAGLAANRLQELTGGKIDCGANGDCLFFNPSLAAHLKALHIPYIMAQSRGVKTGLIDVNKKLLTSLGVDVPKMLIFMP